MLPLEGRVGFWQRESEAGCITFVGSFGVGGRRQHSDIRMLEQEHDMMRAFILSKLWSHAVVVRCRRCIQDDQHDNTIKMYILLH